VPRPLSVESLAKLSFEARDELVERARAIFNPAGKHPRHLGVGRRSASARLWVVLLGW